MIDRYQGPYQGDDQFIDEQSFNQELFLMKLEGQVVAGSPAVFKRMQQQHGDRTVSTHANTNSQRKNFMQQHLIVDSTFDYAETSNFEQQDGNGANVDSDEDILTRGNEVDDGMDFEQNQQKADYQQSMNEIW